jgi:CubicO group peptidase (beta-lactamase class C family)
MTRNHLPGGRDLGSCAIGLFSEAKYEGTGFGLGFAMTLDQTVSGLPCEGEFFWGGAASTYFWVDPKDDLVCIFMTQLMPSTTFDFRGQLKDIVYSAIDE